MRVPPLATHPYVLTHLISFASYPLVRNAFLDTKKLNEDAGFGLTREGMVMVTLVLVMLFKLNSHWTPEHFCTIITFYLRIAIAMLVYFGRSWEILFVYAAVWFALWATVDLPRYTEPSQLVEVTGEEFVAIMDNYEASKAKNPDMIDRYVFCVFYSELSPESVLVGSVD
jgi:hypothetical protein